jgi:hypothetical protein
MLGKVKRIALEFIVSHLKENCTGLDNAINNNAIRSLVQDEFNIKYGQTDVRRAIRTIRDDRLIYKLIAGRSGYFIAETQHEIDKYIFKTKKFISNQRMLLDYIEDNDDLFDKGKELVNKKKYDDDY